MAIKIDSEPLSKTKQMSENPYQLGSSEYYVFE